MTSCPMCSCSSCSGRPDMSWLYCHSSSHSRIRMCILPALYASVGCMMCIGCLLLHMCHIHNHMPNMHCHLHSTHCHKCTYCLWTVSRGMSRRCSRRKWWCRSDRRSRKGSTVGVTRTWWRNRDMCSWCSCERRGRCSRRRRKMRSKWRRSSGKTDR